MGFGDSRQVAPNRYNRILYGFDARYPGELRFGDFMENAFTQPSTSDGPPCWAGEWRDSGGTNPRLMYFLGLTAAQIQYDASSAGTDYGARSTGGCLHNNGANVERLIQCSGNAANIVIRAIDGTVDAITGTIQRDKLAAVSGALYGSVIAGNRYSAIRFAPYGAAPNTAASWSGSTTVGWASTDINNIVSVRGVPCILKPEGVFLYNRGKDQWENMMPGWEGDPHPDNGRAAVSRGPDVVISRGRGGLVLFDGYTVRDISPYFQAAPNDDTTPEKISCLTLWKGFIVAVTSVSQGLRGGSGNKELHGLVTGVSSGNQKLLAVGTNLTEGIRFWRTQDNEVTFTNGATNAGDEDASTSVSLNAQSTAANGDYFVIGYRYPWRACLINFGTSGLNTNASTLSAEYWNGSAWAAMAIVDLMSTNPTTANTLGKAGLVILTGNPTDWTTRTYGTAGVDDSGGYYYIRFSVSAALSATVSVIGVRIIPWRPAIDTTDHPNDGIDRSGCYPHVLFGQITEEGAIWHDMGTPLVADEIGIVVGAHVGGAVGVDPRKLVLLGGANAYYFHHTESDAWPWLAPRGLAEFGFRRIADGHPVRLKTIRIDGRDFNGLTSMSFYYRYDSNERWSKVLLGARPPFVSKIKIDASAGMDFQWAIGYVMSDTTDPHVQRRPAVTGVTAEFELVAEREGMLAQRTIGAIPRG